MFPILSLIILLGSIDMSHTGTSLDTERYRYRYSKYRRLHDSGGICITDTTTNATTEHPPKTKKTHDNLFLVFFYRRLVDHKVNHPTNKKNPLQAQKFRQYIDINNVIIIH